MLKIVNLATDSRSVNFSFLDLLAERNNDFKVVQPNKEALSYHDIPADIPQIEKFLISECQDGDCLILSLDTLLYGGLLESRRHNLPKKELKIRLGLLKALKETNPSLKIYAYSTVLRSVPATIKEGEPEYYGVCGEEIFLYGQNEHLRREKAISKAQFLSNKRVLLPICRPYLKDYLSRRKKNLLVTKAAISLVESVIDEMFILNEKPAYYGFCSLDLKKLIYYSQKKSGIVTVSTCADGMGQIILSRIISGTKEYSPKVCPIFANPYDAATKKSVKDIICSVGAVFSDEKNADILLFCNFPAPNNEAMLDLGGKHNYTDFVYKMRKALDEKKKIALADAIGGKEGDSELVRLVSEKIGIFRLTGFSGRNDMGAATAEALSQSIFNYIGGNGKAHKKRIATRVYEDIIYPETLNRHKVAIDNAKENENITQINILVGETAEKSVPELFSRYGVELDSVPQGDENKAELIVKEKD